MLHRKAYEEGQDAYLVLGITAVTVMSKMTSALNWCPVESGHHPGDTVANAEVAVFKRGNRVAKILSHFPPSETHAHVSLSGAHHCISLHATLFLGICCYDNVWQQGSMSAKSRMVGGFAVDLILK